MLHCIHFAPQQYLKRGQFENKLFIINSFIHSILSFHTSLANYLTVTIFGDMCYMCYIVPYSYSLQHEFKKIFHWFI